MDYLADRPVGKRVRFGPTVYVGRGRRLQPERERESNSSEGGWERGADCAASVGAVPATPAPKPLPFQFVHPGHQQPKTVSRPPPTPYWHCAAPPPPPPPAIATRTASGNLPSKHSKCPSQRQKKRKTRTRTRFASFDSLFEEFSGDDDESDLDLAMALGGPDPIMGSEEHPLALSGCMARRLYSYSYSHENENENENAGCGADVDDDRLLAVGSDSKCSKSKSKTSPSSSWTRTGNFEAAKPVPCPYGALGLYQPDSFSNWTYFTVSSSIVMRH